MQSGITRQEYTVPVSFQLIPANLELDSKSGVKEITLTLEGKTRDIALVDGSKLEAKIDAKDFTPGFKRIEVSRSMVNVPSFVEVLTIDPKSISVNVLEKVEKIEPVKN